MRYANASAIKSLVVATLCLCLLPSAAMADTKRYNCGDRHRHTLQRAIDALDPGDTLIVRGTCYENVMIGERHRNIVIDGQGAAVIDGSGNPNAATVSVRGRSVAIKGFTIIGGRHGVQYANGGTGLVDGNQIRYAANHGVGVFNNSFATIVNNTIEQSGVNGICICEHSASDIGFRGDFATQASPNVVRHNGGNGILVADASYAEIESNQINNNAGTGILVENSASAKIGFQSGPAGTFASANTIEFNGNRGIIVARSSSARIVENLIRNNTIDGVAVVRASSADISANAIDGNSRHGILVIHSSGVNVGNDAGLTPQDQPNNTVTNNGGFGIACLINSSADGRLGGLNGASGA
ncbi:MAG: right-handed parallel beta-helix repeat-containing protein, partial [Betaproteobacteria bacterium]|nr:right-handed parallel beta-helix repeat-containing protein [Betaproteobacteria bacterium]